MAGSVASLPVPRLQLLYTAIERMLDHVCVTALADSSAQHKEQHQQRVQQWKHRVMVSLAPPHPTRSALPPAPLIPPLLPSPLLAPVSCDGLSLSSVVPCLVISWKWRRSSTSGACSIFCPRWSSCRCDPPQRATLRRCQRNPQPIAHHPLPTAAGRHPRCHSPTRVAVSASVALSFPSLLLRTISAMRSPRCISGRRRRCGTQQTRSLHCRRRIDRAQHSHRRCCATSLTDPLHLTRVTDAVVCRGG